MLPQRVQMYLMADLAATPDVLSHLLKGVTNPIRWDDTPDPERFTLREVVAHLADWESVFQERLWKTRDDPGAVFADHSPGQLALDHDYAHADPLFCLTQFGERRLVTLDFLNGLTPAQWDYAGRHSQAGLVTISEQAVMMSGHDGYHLRQAVQWLSAS